MYEGNYRRDEYSLEWASVATTATMQAPSTDTEIDCRNAKKILVQVDQISTTYAGADTDINLITRSEVATTYDTVPLGSLSSLGSAACQSFSVAPGFGYMKLRVDNNSTSAKCAPKVIVQVTG